MAIPVAWCLLSAMTLYELGERQFLVPLAAAGLAVIASVMPRR